MDEKKIIKVRELEVLVVRKPVKNYYLSVLPTDGRVRVSIPQDISDEIVRAFVVRKYDWIKKRVRVFKSQERQTKREYVSGETHYLRGRRYILRVEHSRRPEVEIVGKRYIYFYVPDCYTVKQRERCYESWLRKELRKDLAVLVPKWEKIMGLKVNEVRIKKMKTKWGSCNPWARRIWINLELIKKPQKYLEYVIVHELAHFVEKTHTKKFKTILDKYMCGWEVYRKELNEFIL